MINYENTRPYLHDDLDYNEDSTLDAHMADCGHSHLSDLFLLRQDLLKTHVLLHAQGKVGGDREHDECLELLDKVDDWGARAFKAIWS